MMRTHIVGNGDGAFSTSPDSAHALYWWDQTVEDLSAGSDHALWTPSPTGCIGSFAKDDRADDISASIS